MKKLILAASLLIALGASAQDKERSEKWKEHKKEWESHSMPMMMHTIGVDFQKFDGLNSRIAESTGLEQLPGYTATVSLGALKSYKQFVHDFEIMAGTSLSGDNKNEMHSVIRYYGAAIDFGYDVLKNERLMLYPFAGVNYQKYQARLYRDNSNVNFDNYLGSPTVQNNTRPTDLTNNFFNYRAGLGFNAMSPMGMGIGLRAAYTGSFNERTWKSGHESDLAGAPSDRLSKFSVSLVFTGMPMMGMHHK